MAKDSHAPAGQESPVRGRRWLRRAWLASAAVIAVVVVLAFSQFRLPGHGFTFVLDFGETLGLPRLAEIDAVNAYIHPGVPGYDGQMYAQLALRPLADDPELLRVIDNPPYRARRVFMGWVSWALGFGQPAWVLDVHAWLNVVTWIGLALVLLRWFRPGDGVHSLVRWSGVLLSAGMLSSMRHALTDGPALFLVATAVALLEAGRRWGAVAVGAVAGLTRETAVLFGVALVPDRWADGRRWLRVMAEGALLVAPLALWMWHLRDLALSTAYHNTGVANFTWPFAGYIERWGELLGALAGHGWHKTAGSALLAHAAITVNMAWIVFRPQWSDRWWRIGAVHVVLLASLNTQVWEGYPGAAARVLLPLLLAFNITVPRGRGWLVLIVVGNLSVFSGMREMGAPPQPVWSVDGPRTLVRDEQGQRALWVEMHSGFYATEGRGGNSWQWSSGDAVIRLHNRTGAPVRARLRLELRAATERLVRLRVADTLIWSGMVDERHERARTDSFVIAPGATDLHVLSGPGELSTEDPPRLRAVRIFVFDVIAEP